MDYNETLSLCSKNLSQSLLQWEEDPIGSSGFWGSFAQNHSEILWVFIS